MVTGHIDVDAAALRSAIDQRKTISMFASDATEANEYAARLRAAGCTVVEIDEGGVEPEHWLRLWRVTGRARSVVASR